MSASFAYDSLGPTSFLPENNLNIPVDNKMANLMTEEKFDEIISKVATIYSPIIQDMGAKLVMNKDWKSGKVNASAQQSGNNWQINMFGGLARHPYSTDDGFMMVVCHELGHHIGGAPRNGLKNEWASNEGQADYFASLKCMRRVLENDDNIAIVAEMSIDGEATRKCKAVYKTVAEIALCQRVAMAGKAQGRVSGTTDGNTNPRLETPDMNIVKQTIDYHPESQCRLDTYFAGMLCDKSTLEDVSKFDAILGTCNIKEGYQNGVRPRCWYKPHD